MASRSRLPIIGSALFLLLGAGAYFLPTFVPYLAINGINIVEHKDLIAIGFGVLAALFLVLSFVGGRSKGEGDDTSDETNEEAVVVEISDTPAAESAPFFDSYDVPAFDNTVEESNSEAPKKLTSTEKRAMKAAAKADKKRAKEEAKFAKIAEKEAAKAAKAAAKIAAKGASVESEILDEKTVTEWYENDEFLNDTVTETPAVEEVTEVAAEVAEVTSENWTEAAYTDPTFTVPFADETIETPAEAEAEVESEETEIEIEVESPVEENADVVLLKAQVAALEDALADQAQNTQYALLELSEATRSNSTARLEWLKDMVEKNNFGDDVVLRMIDMLIRQSKADEGTVQSALSANDLRN